MISSIRCVRGLAVAAALISVISGHALGESRIPVGNSKYDDANANIFLDNELTSINVTMAPADLTAMLSDPHNPTYRHCTVQVVNSRINETVTDVAIRPRGNTSLDAIKKSFKLKFNEFVPGREFHGVEKFNVNGEHNDPSIIRAKLSLDLIRRMGVAAPRAHHVRFKINDGALVEDIFINVEQIDDEFVAAWFGSDTGNLYQCNYQGARADLRYVAPGTPATYQNLGGGQTYVEENNEASPNFADLAGFIDFVNNSSDAAFAAGISERINLDSFLRAMAIDVVIGQWDNYWYGANNYYFYNNPVTGRFEFLPYDYDNTYGVDFFNINWATRPLNGWGSGGFGSTSGQLPPLMARLLNIPVYEEQLRRYVRQIVGATDITPPLPSSTFTDTVGDIYAGLGPHYDISSVKLSNDAVNLYVELQTAGPINVGGDTGNGEYVFLFNTRTGGSSTNPWGRAINATVQHDFFVGSWPDGSGGALIYERTGGSWQPRGSAGLDLSSASSGILRYSILLSTLEVGIGATINFDVASTGGNSSDPGFDHLSNPAMATPNITTPSTPGVYKTYITQPVPPAPPGDGPFTLAQVNAKIDAIKAMIEPYAYLGSYANGNMDWGYTAANFSSSYTSPTAFTNSGSGWDWGLKPFITARTNYLVTNVTAPPMLPRIRINEIVASNYLLPADEWGDHDDWVELHNAESTPVDISEWYLSDDPGHSRKWQIPVGTVIPAGGHLLIWCDSEPGEGPLHATFALSAGGEGVGLFHDVVNGNVQIDYVPFPRLGLDISYGRSPDGGSAIGYMTTVTPGAANAASNSPPTVGDATRTPATPLASDTVWITLPASDDGAIAAVALWYNTGAGYLQTQMLDDGMHQDGIAGDGIYGAAIPAQPSSTIVSYYVTATDDDGGVSYAPAGGPPAPYSYVVAYSAPTLFINEYMADNANAFADPDEPGEFPDWFELYNASAVPVDLSGMYLTDNSANTIKYLIPAGVTIPAGGHLLFIADEDGLQGPLHTNFKMSAGGEFIGLFDTLANGNAPIDTFTFGPQIANLSEGRFGDGMTCIRRQETFTPGAPNTPRFADQNADGLVNGRDIAVFVGTITTVNAPITARDRADLNCDSLANAADVPHFVTRLLN